MNRSTPTRTNRARTTITTAVRRSTTVAAVAFALAATSFVPTAQGAAAAKAGGKCTKAGATSKGLTCTRKAGKLVWAKAAAATTAAPTTKAATAAPSPAQVAPTPAAAPAGNGIEGTWKATQESVVGYRVKEILSGQAIEGVGRTNAVTGTLTIAGTTVTAVELTADLTTLKSDEPNRDRQVQGRILETSKFPTAVIKLKTPIDLGSVPEDKAEISKNTTVSFTLHGTTKDLPLELKARRNGTKIEINGAVKIVFADYGITNPSFPPLVTTDPDGLMEFLVVLAK